MDEGSLDEDEEDALGAFDGLHIEEEPPVEVAGEPLDLQLDEPVADPVEAAEAADFGAPTPLDEAVDEAVDEDEEAGEESADRAAAGTGSESDDELVFAEEGDRMATRLDLARAYLDMGDRDGARAILEEVAQGGNAEQQQEAKTLLDGLG
jgi:pilus assembly protein FimV